LFVTQPSTVIRRPSSVTGIHLLPPVIRHSAPVSRHRAKRQQTLEPLGPPVAELG